MNMKKNYYNWHSFYYCLQHDSGDCNGISRGI